MQLKYLNFHKFMANFAGNLVGAFVALIIYQYTQSFSYTFLYLVYEVVIRIATNYIFKNLYFKKPQIMLLFRIITMMGYNIFVLIMDSNLLICIIFIGLFKGIDNSLSTAPNEVIYNYSSLNRDSGSMGVTRLVEKLGIVLATIIGGCLLDFNKTLVVCVAIGIYSISLIPLLIFYFKSRGSALFNKDATSNAIVNLYENKHQKEKGKDNTKKLLLRYAIIYFIFSFVDITNVTFKFLIFSTGGKYAVVGIYSAILQASYAIGSLLFGIIDAKKDTTILVSVSCGVLALVNILLFVLKSYVIFGVLYFVMGLLLPALSIYVLQRYLTKSRILGVSNEALIIRENSCQFAYLFLYGVGAITGILYPIFIIIAIATGLCCWAIPHNEEKTRKILVDVLQNNEIRATSARKRLRE